jgi:hypothetical protein
MVLLKAGQTQYYGADEQIVDKITFFNFRNAKPLPSAIPNPLCATLETVRTLTTAKDDNQKRPRVFRKVPFTYCSYHFDTCDCWTVLHDDNNRKRLKKDVWKSFQHRSRQIQTP